MFVKSSDAAIASVVLGLQMALGGEASGGVTTIAAEPEPLVDVPVDAAPEPLVDAPVEAAPEPLAPLEVEPSPDPAEACLAEEPPQPISRKNKRHGAT